MYLLLLHFLLALCLLIGLMAAIPAYAAQWHDELPQAKLIGKAELRWFGLKIYKAALWSAKTPFDPEQSFALELTYQRSIDRERIVQTSIGEIRRLFGDRYSEARLAQWQQLMSNAFIDVSEGDQLTGVYLSGIGCRFYNRTDLLAEIRDVEFAQAFFAIWLDARTKDTKLRSRLMGTDK